MAANLEEIEGNLRRIADGCGYDYSIQEGSEIDKNLLIISAKKRDKTRAEVWVFAGDDGVIELRIDGDVPGLEVDQEGLDSNEKAARLIKNVFQGNVERLSLPFYSQLKVGSGDDLWSGVKVDFHFPFGKTKFSAYDKV